MTKQFVLLILTASIFLTKPYAQQIITNDNKLNTYLVSQLDSMGIDSGCMLNRYEVEYFNAKLKKERAEFNFEGKKIAFFNSIPGGVLKDKLDYFVTKKKKLKKKEATIVAKLILFDRLEKTKAGDYDAVIVYESKMIRSKRHYINQLRKEGIVTGFEETEETLEL